MGKNRIQTMEYKGRVLERDIISASTEVVAGICFCQSLKSITFISTSPIHSSPTENQISIVQLRILNINSIFSNLIFEN